MSDMVGHRTNPPRSRKLVIHMSGAPGSGKSTVARLLGKSIEGVAFDHTTTHRLRLNRRGEDSPWDGEERRLRFGGKTYPWLVLGIGPKDMAEQERRLIVDSTCNFREVLEHSTALT